MTTEVVIAGIAAFPPTVMAFAAWRNARITKEQTNGALHEPLAEIRCDMADLKADVRDLKADVRILKGR